MKRTTTLTLAIGTVLAVGALTLPVVAQQLGHDHANAASDPEHAPGRRAGHGMMGGDMMNGGMTNGGMMSPEMMQMMMQMHGGSGMGGMNAGMMGQMAEGADSDGNGVVSPEELHTSLANRLATFDTDGDGTLSLAEFETMHAAMIRPMMVDRFQALDEDGDGQVTNDEMTAMAGQMQRMMQMRAQLGGAHGHQGEAGAMMNGQGAGRMMSDN